MSSFSARPTRERRGGRVEEHDEVKPSSTAPAVGFVVDGVLFELVPTTDPDVLSGRGSARLTLAVEQIETGAQDLRAKGVAVSEIRAVANGRLASLMDPDGNELVLWQYA